MYDVKIIKQSSLGVLISLLGRLIDCLVYVYRFQSAAARAQQQELQSRLPLDKHHADSVANFLVRIACQVNESSTTMGSPGEALSRRCVMLLKMIVRQDVCPGLSSKPFS